MRIRLHPPTEIVCGFCCLLALALLYRFPVALPLHDGDFGVTFSGFARASMMIFFSVRSWFDVMIRGPRSSLFALCSSSVFDGFFRCSSVVKIPFSPKFIRSSWPSVSLILDMVLAVFVAAVASFSFRWTVYRMKGETGSRRLENSLSRFFASSSSVVIIPDAWALAPLHHFFVGEA